MAEWRYAIEGAPAGLLKRIDRAILAGFVVHSDIGRQARELVGEEMVITTPSGRLVQNPALTIVNTQAALTLRFAAELGFTPASRSRVSITPEPGPVDEFFGG